jgi:hypothetical protein
MQSQPNDGATQFTVPEGLSDEARATMLEALASQLVRDAEHLAAMAQIVADRGPAATGAAVVDVQATIKLVVADAAALAELERGRKPVPVGALSQR